MLMVVAAAGIPASCLLILRRDAAYESKKPSAASARSETPASPAIAPAGFADDFQDESCHPGVNQLGALLPDGAPGSLPGARYRVSNGPAEAVNNLIERIKRMGFGFCNFGNYRIRALLYAPGFTVRASGQSSAASTVLFSRLST